VKQPNHFEYVDVLKMMKDVPVALDHGLQIVAAMVIAYFGFRRVSEVYKFTNEMLLEDTNRGGIWCKYNGSQTVAKGRYHVHIWKRALCS
jgi:hypothetical protein